MELKTMEGGGSREVAHREHLLRERDQFPLNSRVESIISKNYLIAVNLVIHFSLLSLAADCLVAVLKPAFYKEQVT